MHVVDNGPKSRDDAASSGVEKCWAECEPFAANLADGCASREQHPFWAVESIGGEQDVAGGKSVVRELDA
jgi:hypothetical protein